MPAVSGAFSRSGCTPDRRGLAGEQASIPGSKMPNLRRTLLSVALRYLPGTWAGASFPGSKMPNLRRRLLSVALRHLRPPGSHPRGQAHLPRPLPSRCRPCQVRSGAAGAPSSGEGWRTSRQACRLEDAEPQTQAPERGASASSGTWAGASFPGSKMPNLRRRPLSVALRHLRAAWVATTWSSAPAAAAPQLTAAVSGAFSRSGCTLIRRRLAGELASIPARRCRTSDARS
jgi:hypothetical protein